MDRLVAAAIQLIGACAQLAGADPYPKQYKHGEKRYAECDFASHGVPIATD